LSLVQQASTATLDLIALLQLSTELCGQLDEVAAAWHPSALVHRDVKWDNVLLGQVGGRRRITMVDWELAGFGDPAWDLGSVIADYLGLWLSSLPAGAGRGIDSYVDHARVPLQSLQPAIRAFWHEYRRARCLDDKENSCLLTAAVKNGAARLLQTAFEYAQGQRELDDRAVASVQLANNILRDPPLAALQLLDLASP
jgi:aminoglycoside phosphotransferase (APT) family kinase protein